MNRPILLILLLLLTLASCTVCTPPKYYQCGQSWSPDPLNNGPKTICQVGCAMTSLAMILANQGVQLSKALANPGTLNTWLKTNNGYSGQSLIWSASNALSSCKYQDKVTDINTIIREVIDTSKHFILNVHSGGHWVLAVGYDPNTKLFLVNDPGSQSTTTYSPGDVSQAAYYKC
jgi:hypothetical protein